MVCGDQAAREGPGNPGASADEDRAVLNAKRTVLPGWAWVRRVGAEAAQYRGSEQVAADQGAAKVPLGGGGIG